ncbi:hypothetical protein [Lyngbya sp. CCY1209]|jgi:hypothetical protein|uniref:hypothetical protein n=1 Tax=Lyngbya sp. CCY1209 TaxID=2886103 RepID=UPI002D217B8A|nr:hypothetical protein [Lyngbya sp. CCY1209]MEB3886479.1 hypothetical protein [Lyngbya sp. CCY1209]
MTTTKIQEIYTQVIQKLPPRERLQLAALILNRLVTGEEVDESETWTEEDQLDLVTYALKYADDGEF